MEMWRCGESDVWRCGDVERARPDEVCAIRESECVAFALLRNELHGLHGLRLRARAKTVDVGCDRAHEPRGDPLALERQVWSTLHDHLILDFLVVVVVEHTYDNLLYTALLADEVKGPYFGFDAAAHCLRSAQLFQLLTTGSTA